MPEISDRGWGSAEKFYFDLFAFQGNFPFAFPWQRAALHRKHESYSPDTSMIFIWSRQFYDETCCIICWKLKNFKTWSHWFRTNSETTMFVIVYLFTLFVFTFSDKFISLVNVDIVLIKVPYTCLYCKTNVIFGFHMPENSVVTIFGPDLKNVFVPQS